MTLSRFDGLGKRSAIVDALHSPWWSVPFAMRALYASRADVESLYRRGKILHNPEREGRRGIVYVSAGDVLTHLGQTRETLLSEANPQADRSRGGRNYMKHGKKPRPVTTYARHAKVHASDLARCLAHVTAQLRHGEHWLKPFTLYNAIWQDVKVPKVVAVRNLNHRQWMRDAGLNPDSMPSAKALLIDAGLLHIRDEDRTGSRVSVELLDPATMDLFTYETLTDDGAGLVVGGTAMHIGDAETMNRKNESSVSDS